MLIGRGAGLDGRAVEEVRMRGGAGRGRACAHAQRDVTLETSPDGMLSLSPLRDDTLMGCHLCRMSALWDVTLVGCHPYGMSSP